MVNFWRNLNDFLFKRHLLMTNTVSSGILMSMGDALSQRIEQNQSAKDKDKVNAKGVEKVYSQIDWSRNAKMFAVGAVQGPLHQNFYGWLDKKYSGITVKTTTIKILYDQFVMAPVCLVQFFYMAGWLYGKTNAECWQELKSKFFTVYAIDWTVWPAAQFINFYCLPPKYRVIYVNFVTMLWDVFLSYIKHINPDQTINLH